MRKEDRPWDSQFFGVRIVSGYQTRNDDPDSLRAFCKGTDADCLYLFLHHPLSPGFEPVLRELGAVCVDWKTLFVKDGLVHREMDDRAVHRVDRISEDCYRTAVQAGWKSRFYTDERFRPKQPLLYRKWVDRFCPPTADSGIWEYRTDDGAHQGMICAECGGNVGKLALIAVSPECRGNGIGGLMMQFLENYYLDRGCTRAEVVTQFGNAGACRLYRKSGYRISEIKEVWHLWKT